MLIPILIFWKWKKYRQQFAELKLSNLKGVEKTFSIKTFLRPFLAALKILSLCFLILAIARPQNVLKEEKIKSEGIDIAIAVDISGSMLARDFQPDRLGAAKNTAKDFIDNRKMDRVGLVVFAGESFTQCPITTDHNILKKLIDEVESGMVEDGTAIGMGLATGVNRLKESKADSKVMILLTDGINNKGFIDPLTAAETARELGVKVYTIGVGTQGKAPYPYRGFFGEVLKMVEVEIDEELLQKIADMTGGKYFRATNNNSLKNIYAEIDQLEKSEIEVTSIKRYTEQFHIFALIAGLLLLLDFLLKNTLFRSIP